MSILFSSPQGCILGPLSFVICVWDLFVVNNPLEFGSYVDDTTPFSSGEILDQIVNEPEETYG